jgi:hypothetical protein
MEAAGAAVSFASHILNAGDRGGDTELPELVPAYDSFFQQYFFRPEK